MIVREQFEYPVSANPRNRFLMPRLVQMKPERHRGFPCNAESSFQVSPAWSTATARAAKKANRHSSKRTGGATKTDHPAEHTRSCPETSIPPVESTDHRHTPVLVCHWSGFRLCHQRIDWKVQNVRKQGSIPIFRYITSVAFNFRLGSCNSFMDRFICKYNRR